MKKVLIVGYSRSGTTLVSKVFSLIDKVYVEVEPHATWRLGNFRYLNDEDYSISDKIVTRIREKLLKDVPSDYVFVEKSPINSLRPHLVHAVFPDAKIIFIERDPVKCIKSNYKFAKKGYSFSLSVILKKYSSTKVKFDKTNNNKKDNFHSKSIKEQIDFKDVFGLSLYALQMSLIKMFKTVPFGPKIKGFTSIIKQKGLIAYYIEALKSVETYRCDYERLYQDNFKHFYLEDFLANKEIQRQMLEFSGVPYNNENLIEIEGLFSKSENSREELLDRQIQKHLDDH
ncbi:sulfotransferase family protein [Leeuwenhoekiella palythoae]|uniref:Sulfotransferase domain-containing protein n=1 Tax=Leeuwenhoekiella palythoae TaxID=573501 RepID=A0A1M5UD07_9FLAO|nr:sulfotransferase [Leeuwenhoekiella palythoae]RXG27156.1 sulfotransferase domain-containing protein [Leeuwenhoekiella palythoae]SHH60914.1 Sulfotransferase domain-containing protein [Leeuwenhoekiella palythoae]